MTGVHRAVALFRACHPEPTMAVTIAAIALAAASGRDSRGLLAVGLAILTGQLCVGWFNDYLDADRDRTANRQDKPVATGVVSRDAVRTATVVAAALCVPFSLLSGVLAGTTHIVAVASAWTYNLGLKSTQLSVLPYAVSFGLLPAFVIQGLPGHPAPAAWLVSAGALLGSGAHFANVLPDLEDDAATGVRGLPHRLGATGARLAAAALLLAASAVLVIGPPGPPTRTAWAALALACAVLAAGYALGRRPNSRAVFRSVLVVAVIDVLLLVASGVQVR
jgi:4-hydroxybenzoate polyprenyltransferase